VPYGVTEAGSPTISAKGSDLSERTHPRVQVVFLCVCAAASGAMVAAAHLPWFGSLSDSSVPEKSAVSGELWRTGLVPGAQTWGYLLIAWSALLAAVALIAALACALLRPRNQRPLRRLLMYVGVASLVLVALVLPELTTSAQFDLVSYAHPDWGAWIGLGLAVVSSVGAWLAWATWRFPHLWGLDTSAVRPRPREGGARPRAE
jgi:hypothetical protein